MTWTIPLQHKNFPPLYQQNLRHNFSVDALDILWGTITVGRPDYQTVYAHGQYSIDEVIYRQAVVRANLQLDSPAPDLVQSPAFDALDPTEKAGVNFQLGMIFAKIFASKYLDIPWLRHFKCFASNNSIMMQSTRSTPDFVGYSSATRDYHIIEAKGRVGGLSTNTLRKAKIQAQQPITVSGKTPTTRIGTLLYRTPDNNLAFACEDPKEDGGLPIELQETVETWQQYYRLAWDLHNLDEERHLAIKALTGISVRLDSEILNHVKTLMIAEKGSGYHSVESAIQEIKNYPKNYYRKDEHSPHRHTNRRVFADGIEIGYYPYCHKY